MKTLELAKELIGFETTSPVEDTEIFDFAALYLEDHGIESQIHDFDGVKSLTASFGSGSPSICFSGHLDTVAPGANWEKTQPYEPKVEEGKLYGRGATDMKTECAALINAAVRLKESDFDGSLTLMLTGDEEIGGERGTKKLVENKYDYAVIGEPTDLNVQIGTRGILWLDVVLEGCSAHSSRASRTTGNLFDKVPQVLEVLNDLEMDDSGDSILPGSTAEVTTVSADNAYNSVPSEIKLGMDFRYSNSWDSDRIIDRLEDKLSGLNVDYRIEIVNDMMDPWILKDDNFKMIVSESVEEVKGCKPEHITEGGASDGRYFAENGTSFIELGLDQDPVHQQDEYCRVENIEILEDIYVNIAMKLSGKSL